MTSDARNLLRKDLRELASLAAPAAVLQLASMGFGVVDSIMVGHVSQHAFDGAVLGGIWLWGSMVFGMGVVFGIDPFISQGFGANDQRGMAHALQRGIISALLVSVPIMLAWLFTADGLILLGQDPDVSRAAGSFVRIQIPSVAPFLVFTAMRQYLVNRRIIAPTIVVLIAGNVINACLNWVLIYGHLGSPALGLDGSAYASSIGRVLMVVLLGAWVAAGRLHDGAWVPWSRDSFSPRGLLAVAKVGVPVGFQMGSEVWAFQLAMLMAGWLGKPQLAAHGIVLNLASLSFMVPLGVSIGAGTLVGNRLGARDLAGAKRAARLSLGVGAGVMTGSAVLFVVFRNALPHLYGADAEVAPLAAAILPIAAAFQLFDGTQAVGCGVLRGMGISRPPAIFNLVGYWVLSLPLAWWLASRAGWGLAGIWWGLALGLAMIAVALVVYVFRMDPKPMNTDVTGPLDPAAVLEAEPS